MEKGHRDPGMEDETKLLGKNRDRRAEEQALNVLRLAYDSGRDREGSRGAEEKSQPEEAVR